MIVKKTATSLVAALTLAPLTMGAGVAAAAGSAEPTVRPESAATYEPADRRPADRDRGDRGRGQAPSETPPEETQTPKDPCPTELWTIPIEIEGLLCVLILEKNEDKPPQEPAPAPAAAHR